MSKPSDEQKTRHSLETEKLRIQLSCECKGYQCLPIDLYDTDGQHTRLFGDAKRDEPVCQWIFQGD